MLNACADHTGGLPFYLPQHDEEAVFLSAWRRRLPALLKGPTGCGKSRFVRYMAARLGRALHTVACHDDLSASDLLGRFLIKGEETVWQDGPLTRAVREGAICYLDEVVEARKDTTVILHPLADDRRELPLDRTGELLAAPPEFMLVVSYNPGYQNLFKNLKPSTRQRREAHGRRTRCRGRVPGGAGGAALGRSGDQGRAGGDRARPLRRLARLRLRPTRHARRTSWHEPPGRALPVAASYLHAGNHFRKFGSTVQIASAQGV